MSDDMTVGKSESHRRLAAHPDALSGIAGRTWLRSNCAMIAPPSRDVAFVQSFESLATLHLT
jgi:hypothetical protein